MNTSIDFDKDAYVAPAAVTEVIYALGSRPEPSAIREAITQLRQFREILMQIYIAELNDEGLDRRVVRALIEGEDYKVVTP